MLPPTLMYPVALVQQRLLAGTSAALRALTSIVARLPWLFVKLASQASGYVCLTNLLLSRRCKIALGCLEVSTNMTPM